MSMRLYQVVVGTTDGETRLIKVPSRTGVQAGDAAAGLMQPGETILEILEKPDPVQDVDGPPAGTRARPDQSMTADRAHAPAPALDSELLLDGQEEVFSRTEVELGRIEHQTDTQHAPGSGRRSTNVAGG